MTFVDNEQCSNSNVQRKITEQEQSKYGPLKKTDVGSSAMEE